MMILDTQLNKKQTCSESNTLVRKLRKFKIQWISRYEIYASIFMHMQIHIDPNFIEF